jgi:hypothetical protein
MQRNSKNTRSNLDPKTKFPAEKRGKIPINFHLDSFGVEENFDFVLMNEIH